MSRARNWLNNEVSNDDGDNNNIEYYYKNALHSHKQKSMFKIYLMRFILSNFQLTKAHVNVSMFY